MEIVAEGLEFPEGPIACSDGSILLVEIKRGTLSRVSPEGAVSVVAELGGGPNGAAIGPDGAVYVCNNGGMTWRKADGLTVPGPAAPEGYAGGSIQRVDLASGEIKVLYTHCDGRPLRGPNDLVFDRGGGIWFTDLGKTVGDHIYPGAVFYAAPDGGHISRQREPIFANGVGLSPDQRSLHVAETRTGRLWTLALERPGRLAPPISRWDLGACVSLRGYQLLDSLAVEAGGKVCVATIGDSGITVIDGRDVFEHFPIAVDRMVTNICFGGSDMCDAWITCSGTGRLYKTRWPRPGLRLNFNL